MRSAILTRIGPRIQITGHPYAANVGDTYSFTFGVTGAVGAVTWSGFIPASSGLTLTGAPTLAGICAAGGSFQVSVSAEDSLRQRATATFVLVILGSRPVLRTESGDPMFREDRNQMHIE